MKSTNTIARIALTLLCLAAFASASFAATKPLSEPFGLALDSKGDLYVANFGGGEVLVYNPAYNQIASKTISNSLTSPTGVALDINGNVYVSDFSSSAVNQYSPAGKLEQQLTSANGISDPVAVAIDGVGDLFVNNGFLNVSLYAPLLGNQLEQSQSAGALGVTTVYGIATRGGVWALGTDQGFKQTPLDIFFIDGGTNPPVAGTTGSAVAFDGSGNIYSANLDGTLDFYSPPTQALVQFKDLGYAARGMVVDAVRGRIYISNFDGNQIQVYNTGGVLLKTIE
ncbi:MAG: SBBP repeat-containing protein [Terriglobales bacterium]|jgi:streptogramin lyase